MVRKESCDVSFSLPLMTFTYYLFFLVVLGTKLVFVLKLDECQIVKQRRLERMSVTLMNEAMFLAKRTSMEEEHTPSFSVQSEKEIWWLGAIEVPKETHAVLQWIFARIPWITDVIKAQQAGEKLFVDGLGEFDVEWHLGGDLKTIKCLLGCRQGANSLYPCPFCTKGYKGNARTKGRSMQDECEADDNVSHTWERSVLQCPMLDEPDRAVKDSDWNPIISFPLTNVHFCTLHAFMRIFDRLLKLHIDYAFTMKPMERSQEAISKVESLLNSIGCHGTNTSIVAEKKNGSAHEVAQQVSMSGLKARHFLKKPLPKDPNATTTSSSSEGLWELWKDLCKHTTDNDSNVHNVNNRKLVWASFDKMVKVMCLASTTNEQREKFHNLLKEFTDAVVTAWGETNITHYMVKWFFCILFTLFVVEVAQIWFLLFVLHGEVAQI